VLKQAGRLDRHWLKPSKKGTGFVQPLAAHDHWHVDMSYINVAGSFYFLTSILDGYSRFIVHSELRERMTECDTEIVIQRAREKYPNARPRIISDNGPQFIAKEFKEFIRIGASASGRRRRSRPKRLGNAWPATSSITIPCDCMALLATSHRLTNWPDANDRSGTRETPSSRPREKGGPPLARLKRPLPDDRQEPNMTHDLDGG
jgi:hypothetical protein